MDALKLKLKNETDYLNGQVAKYEKYINDSILASIKGDQTDASRCGDAVVEQIPDYGEFFLLFFPFCFHYLFFSLSFGLLRAELFFPSHLALIFNFSFFSAFHA